MASVRSILAKKGTQVYSLPPTATVLDALNYMAEKNIGAVMVMEGEKLVGVFSERDYARRGILQNHSEQTAIADLMTPVVYYIHREYSLEECMALMSGKHIRHLPVVEDERVVGVVSIGDVVTAIIEDQRDLIRGLENYIMGGTYHGGTFIR
jgi:CBS domain-containing protein